MADAAMCQIKQNRQCPTMGAGGCPEVCIRFQVLLIDVGGKKARIRKKVKSNGARDGNSRSGR